MKNLNQPSSLQLASVGQLLQSQLFDLPTETHLSVEKLILEITEKTQLIDQSKLPGLLNQILKNFQCDEEFIQAHTYFTAAPDKYWYAHLAKTDEVEINLCCWSQNQGTKPHSHSGSCCGAFKVLRGILIEERFVPIGEYQPQHILVRRNQIKALQEKSIGLIESDTIHRVWSGSELAVSLHIYMPPISDGEKPIYKVIDE